MYYKQMMFSYPMTHRQVGKYHVKS